MEKDKKRKKTDKKKEASRSSNIMDAASFVIYRKLLYMLDSNFPPQKVNTLLSWNSEYYIVEQIIHR